MAHRRVVIGLVGQKSAGKTTLAEVLLYKTNKVSRIGSVEEGNTFMDWDSQEIKYRMSINAAVAYFELNDVKVTLVDLPGSIELIGELYKSLSIVDGVLLVVDGSSGGIEVDVETAFELCKEANLPMAVVVNKLDREDADFERIASQLSSMLDRRILPLYIPKGTPIKGVENLLDTADEKLIEAIAEVDDALTEIYLGEGSFSREQLEQGLKKGIVECKIFPLFSISATKQIGIDTLLNFIVKFFTQLSECKFVLYSGDKKIIVDPTEEERLFMRAFKVQIDPYVGRLVFCRIYSGTVKQGQQIYNHNQNNAVERIAQLCLIHGKERQEVKIAHRGDVVALVKFSTARCGDTLCDHEGDLCLPKINFPEPTISIAINPKTKEAQERISYGIACLCEEDLTLHSRYDHQLMQTLLYGMGELHLSLILEQLRVRFCADVVEEKPKVAYVETILGSASAEGKYKRQTGGRGQYGHTFLKLEFLPRNEQPEFEFVNKIFGGAIPAKYIPAIEKGVRDTMQKGILAGYPIRWVRCTLYDGSFHEVDSSDIAFQLAASFAFKKAFNEAKPTLLEPIEEVEIVVPQETMGDVIGDINSRRGRILNIEPIEHNKQRIIAQIPTAEMYKYMTTLRTLTKARGKFTSKFSHYDIVPEHIAEKIIQETAQKEKNK